jgi:hypothetical protein
MKLAPVVLCCLAAILLSTGSTHAQFEGFVNKGLVGAGRLSSETIDATGNDTLGGMGSSLWFDLSTWNKIDDQTGLRYTGRLFAISDSGFRQPGADYKPRLHTFQFSLAPYDGAGPVEQNQIDLVNTQTVLFTYSNGIPFTGADPRNISQTNYPQSDPDGPGHGRRSLDPESLALMPDGTFYVGEEYGPFIYHFSRQGELLGTLEPPSAYIPKTYPDTEGGPMPIVFSSAYYVNSGRTPTHGFEAMGVTPDGRRLAALIQGPLVQDGGRSVSSVNSRLLIFDVETNSVTLGRPIAEYVYVLGLQAGNQTTATEIRALNNHQFLVMERDSTGFGTSHPSTYKRVILIDTDGASDILETGYDLDFQTPGQLSLPESGLPNNITPVTRMDFVDMLDPIQLGKFGLNSGGGTTDTNSLASKWEGLALLPVSDPDFPDDYFLLIGNDNDFWARQTIQNGVVVSEIGSPIDNMLLAYRLTLPGATIFLPPPASPQISFEMIEGQLRLSWPASPFPMSLQSSSDPGGEWADASESFDTVNGVNYALVDLAGAPRFFRVKIDY